MRSTTGRMHIDQAGRQYTTVDGQRRAYPCHLLRRSFRDEQGRPRKERLANLSALPLEAIDALRKVLRGATLVDAAAFETERSASRIEPLIFSMSWRASHFPHVVGQ